MILRMLGTVSGVFKVDFLTVISFLLSVKKTDLESSVECWMMCETSNVNKQFLDNLHVILPQGSEN